MDIPSWHDSNTCHGCNVELKKKSKQHCHKCSNTFCGACVSDTTTIPPLFLVPVSVCKPCLATIKAGSSALQRQGSEGHGHEQQLIYPHVFVTKQLLTPTKCGYCNGFIFGLVNQSQRCHDCLLTVHHKCVGLVPANCKVPKVPPTAENVPISRVPSAVRNVVTAHNNNEPATNDAISLEASYSTDYAVLKGMEKCDGCGSFNAKGFTDCPICGKSVREKVIQVTRRNNYVVPETVVAPSRVLNAQSAGSGGDLLRQAAERRAREQEEQRAFAEAQRIADAADAAEAAAAAAAAAALANSLDRSDGAAAAVAAVAADIGFPAAPAETNEDGFEKTGYCKSLKGVSIQEHGDRILLPPSELQPIMDNRCMDLTSSVTQEQLPVFFELENGEWRSRSVVGGLLEFTAAPNTAVIPAWILQTLYAADGDTIRITSVKLPRATRVKFRPVSTAFKGSKDMLEQELSLRYSTLTQGTTIAVNDGSNLVELEILELEPARCCYILNSQVNVEFDAALQPAADESTILALNDPIEAQVQANRYIFWELKNNPAFDDKCIVIELQALQGDPDLFVSQSSSHPSIISNDWNAMLSGGERIVIKPADPKRKKNSFWIGVRGHLEVCSFRLASFLEDEVTEEEALESSGIVPVNSVLSTSEDQAPGPEFVRCKNCSKWVPEQSAFRHEAFCARSITKCAICSALVQASQVSMHNHCTVCKRLVDLANHVHCSICNKGMSKAKLALHSHCALCPTICPPDQLKKHCELFHSNSVECECGRFFDVETMKLHVQYDCDLLLQKCQFCSGEFPKKGLSEHQNRCKGETIKCEICTMRYPRLFMADHHMKSHQ